MSGRCASPTGGWGRQRFHDGARVAELLVAVRQSLNEQERDGTGGDRREAIKVRRWPRRTMHITGRHCRWQCSNRGAPGSKRARCLPKGGKNNWRPGANAGETRWLPWQRRTPSWQAAYNAACLYAALAGSDKYRQNKKAPMDWAIVSLKRVVSDRHCEMERPWDWINHDPDLRCLADSPDYRDLLDKQLKNDYPSAKSGLDRIGTGPAVAAHGLTCRAAAEAGSSAAAVPILS